MYAILHTDNTIERWDPRRRPTLEELQDKVGGLLEPIPCVPSLPIELIGNEEATPLGLLPNYLATTFWFHLNAGKPMTHIPFDRVLRGPILVGAMNRQTLIAPMDEPLFFVIQRWTYAPLKVPVPQRGKPLAPSTIRPSRNIDWSEP